MFQGPVSNSGAGDHIAGQARSGWSKHSASGAPLPPQPPRVLAHNPPPVSRQEPTQPDQISLDGHWRVEYVDGAVFTFKAVDIADARQQVANEAAANRYDASIPVKSIHVTTNTGVVDVLEEIKRDAEYRLFAPGETPKVTAEPTDNIPGVGQIFTVEWVLTGTTSFKAPTEADAQNVIDAIFDPSHGVFLPPLFRWSSAEGAIWQGLPTDEVGDHDHFAYGDVLPDDDDDLSEFNGPFPWDNF